MTDEEVKISLDEVQALGLTLYGEARGELIEGKIFVGSVIRNRVLTPMRWPDTYRRVCFQNAQFSCWSPLGGSQNYERTMDAARFLADKEPLIKNSVLNECMFVARGIVEQVLLDRSGGCNHYVTEALYEQGTVSWLKGKIPHIFVGSHVGFIL
jgi:Cell Wall Hydrolase